MDFYMDYKLDDFPFDDEDDDFDLPRRGNSVKSMAALDIYKIVEQQSSVRKPLRIKDIVTILNEYPYEYGIERKAVSRHVANIIERYPEIRYEKNTGLWYEREHTYRAA